MKHGSFSLIFLFFLMASGCAHNRVDPLTVESIAPNVFVATDRLHHNSRVLIVKGEQNNVLIVSSPFEDRGTRLLMDWVEKNLQPNKIIAINTHYHLDGTGGNPVYHQRGVETWASDLTNKLSEEKGPTMTKDRHVELAKNQFLFLTGKVFNFDGEKVSLIFPGHSHSQDHIAVYFHKKKILFGGCMIKPGKTLGYLGDADPKKWLVAMEKLRSLDYQVVVAGHAKWGDRSLVEKTIANLRTFNKTQKSPSLMKN